MVESVGPREGRNNVLISPDQAKIEEFLNIARPSNKKKCQQVCGLAAQMKKFAPGMQVTNAANVYFNWTEDLDHELAELKDCLRKFVKLSPIDTSKNLILVIESAPTV